MTNRKEPLIILVIGALALLLPIMEKSGYIINLSTVLLLSIGLAVGWNIVGGYGGQISMGHSIFFGVGSLVTRSLWTTEIPFLLALIAGGAASVVIAGCIGLPCLRLRGPYFAIGTLVAALAAHLTVSNVLAELAYLPSGYLAKYTILKPYYASVVVVSLIVMVSDILANSRFGSTLRAISDDQDAAETLGVNTFKYKALALGYSALFTGLMGGIFAFYHVSYYFSYPFDLIWSFSPLLMSYIGGAGTLIGPVIGALVWVGLTELFAVTLGEVHGLVFGIGLMVVVIFLPGGIVQGIDRIRKPISAAFVRKGYLKRG